MTDSEDKAPQSITAALDQALERGLVVVLATLIAPPGLVGAKMIVGEEGTPEGSLGAAALDEVVVKFALNFLGSREHTRAVAVKEFASEGGEWSETQILFERIQAEPRVVICGAGHVGAALAKLANMLGYRPTLIDDRAEFLTRELFPDRRIEIVVAKDWSESVAKAVGNGHGVFVSIVTRGHSEDEQCLRAVMLNASPEYVGLIGSKRRTNIVLQRLRDSGVEDERLKQVHAPIGLDIGAVTPEEVALAIMAEIVAVRRGGKGGSLSEWRRLEKGKG